MTNKSVSNRRLNPLQLRMATLIYCTINPLMHMLTHIWHFCEQQLTYSIGNVDATRVHTCSTSKHAHCRRVDVTGLVSLVCGNEVVPILHKTSSWKWFITVDLQSHNLRLDCTFKRHLLHLHPIETRPVTSSL